MYEILSVDILSISCKFGHRWQPENISEDEVDIGSGNDLVPSGTKPLPEPMLTVPWCQIVSLSYTNINTNINI